MLFVFLSHEHFPGFFDSLRVSQPEEGLDSGDVAAS
jgi:hypothetical protein